MARTASRSRAKAALSPLAPPTLAVLTTTSGRGFVDGAGQADRVTEVSRHGLDATPAQRARGPLRSGQSHDLMFSGGQCGRGHRAQITSRAGDENLQDLFLAWPFPADRRCGSHHLSGVTDGCSYGEHVCWCATRGRLSELVEQLGSVRL